MDQPHSGNRSESLGTLCIVKKKIIVTWFCIFESKLSTNNVIMQFSDLNTLVRIPKTIYLLNTTYSKEWQIKLLLGGIYQSLGICKI